MNNYCYQVEISERDVAVEKVRALAVATLEIHCPLQYWRDVAEWCSVIDALDFAINLGLLLSTFANQLQEGVLHPPTLYDSPDQSRSTTGVARKR